MEEIDYKEKLKKLEADFELAKKQLHYDFAMSNAKFKKGDVIKDERWAFIIDNITVYKSFGLPEPVYSGYELKKDLTPRKDGNRVSIYGNKAILIKEK